MKINDHEFQKQIINLIEKTGYLRVKVTPQSSKNEITEIIMNPETGETIKIKIKAPPEKNKANIELIKFLSKYLGTDKNKIEIIAGKTERTKLIRITK